MSNVTGNFAHHGATRQHRRHESLPTPGNEHAVVQARLVERVPLRRFPRLLVVDGVEEHEGADRFIPGAVLRQVGA